jgi:hypothetical protein
MHVQVLIEENGRIENLIVPNIGNNLSKQTNKVLKQLATTNEHVRIAEVNAGDTYSKYQIDYQPSKYTHTHMPCDSFGLKRIVLIF